MTDLTEGTARGCSTNGLIPFMPKIMLACALFGSMVALSLISQDLSTYSVGVPNSGPRALNTDATTDQHVDWVPKVAADRSGNWVATWRRCRTVFCHPVIGDEGDIVYSRSADNGLNWSPPLAINPDAASDIAADESPDIATDSHGNWIIVWVSDNTARNQLGPDLDLMYSRSEDRGQTWSPPTPLNPDAGQDVRSDNAATIEADGRGNWVATWYASMPGQFSDIYVSRSIDNGVTWSQPALVNPDGLADRSVNVAPRVAVHQSGTWIIRWYYQQGIKYGSDGDILFSRSTDAGASWSPPAALNDDAGHDSAFDGGGGMASGRGNLWMTVWNSAGRNAGTGVDIFMSKSTDNGQTWSSPLPLIADPTKNSGHASNATLETDGAGRWIAMWSSNRLSSTGTIGDYDLYFALSPDDGESWTTPAPFNTNFASDRGDDFAAELASGRSGNWLVVWMSDDSLGGTIGSDYDILHARAGCGLSPQQIEHRPCVFR